VEEPVQTFYPTSFARGRTMSSLDVKKHEIVGRDHEASICMDPLTMGQVICFVGKAGFGKSALLEHIGDQAELKKNCMKLFIKVKQAHLSIPFYAFRKIMIQCLEPLFEAYNTRSNIKGGVSIRTEHIESSRGLFTFCKPVINEEESNKVKDENEESNATNMNEFLKEKKWENYNLLHYIFPTIGIEPQVTSNDAKIDGCLVSVEELQQMATLCQTIINDCLLLRSKERLFLICKSDINFLIFILWKLTFRCSNCFSYRR